IQLIDDILQQWASLGERRIGLPNLAARAKIVAIDIWAIDRRSYQIARYRLVHTRLPRREPVAGRARQHGAEDHDPSPPPQNHEIVLELHECRSFLTLTQELPGSSLLPPAR